MCVPQEKIQSTVIYCPNCNSERVDTKWVAKYVKEKPNRVSMDDKIKTNIPPPLPFFMASSGCDDCSVIEIPIQIVMTCQVCGYTVTKKLER